MQLAQKPSEHQPSGLAPDSSPGNSEYSEATTPASAERHQLEAAVAELGWSNLFELLPPGVAEAYEVICEDLSQLADELSNPPEDPDERLWSLGTYVRTLHHLDQYRDEFGMWWGFPPDTRRELNRLSRELRTSGPFTANQLERLLERWAEVEDESIAEFIELVADDDLVVLDNHAGRIATTTDSGPSALRLWLRAHGGEPEFAPTIAALATDITIPLAPFRGGHNPSSHTNSRRSSPTT